MKERPDEVKEILAYLRERKLSPQNALALLEWVRFDLWRECERRAKTKLTADDCI